MLKKVPPPPPPTKTKKKWGGRGGGGGEERELTDKERENQSLTLLPDSHSNVYSAKAKKKGEGGRGKWGGGALIKRLSRCSSTYTMNSIVWVCVGGGGGGTDHVTLYMCECLRFTVCI